MEKKIKIIVSGPGLIGRTHIGLIKNSSRCTLVAIVGPDLKENAKFSAECGVPLFDSVEKAVSAADVDAAIISSPNAFHFQQASFCVSRRIPVLVEKPITDNLSDASRLTELADALNVPVLVGHHRTYSPLLETARAFIETEKFGRLVAVQAAALFYKPAHYFVDGAWRTVKGGGPILINLIHEIGLLRYFCGEIKSVFAIASNEVRGFEVEDTVALTLQFESGALGTFLLSDTAASDKSWEMTSGENPAYPHSTTQSCYHFAGTNGSLDFPTMQARYYGADATRSWWNQFEEAKLDFIAENPLRLQLDHFIDVVQGLAHPKVSAKDGYMNMLVLEAIGQSIQSRSPIALADLQVKS